MSAEDCHDIRDHSMQHGATSESLHVDAPGSSHMSSHSEELRILSVHGKGEGPLVVYGQDTLYTESELEALSSLSADHSGAKSLDCGERLVHREEWTGQLHTPDTISIKEEEDIGGDMPAVEDYDYYGDRSTQCSATSESLHVDAPGSSHMSSHNGELRILSVHGKGEGPLAMDGHNNLFTEPQLEELSSLSADHSAIKSLDCGERLVHREERTGPRGGCKGHPCAVCGRVFSNNYKLIVHMRTHTGEKPYGCDQCTMRFQQKGNLKLHMRTHTGEKPFRCEQCMKCFQQNYNLKIHMRIHSGEKPYRCDQCVRSFTQRSNLKIHMGIHSGEKPYRCDQCVRSFTQRSSLKIHMRLHSGEKPCVCPHCNARFSDPSNLGRHMAKHTGKGVL